MKWKRTGESLGGGGQGQVYVVEETDGGLPGKYAQKVITNTNRTPRLEIEISVTRSLYDTGASVVEIVDDYVRSERDARKPWYVMPIADGGSLDKLIVGNQPFGGSTQMALRMFADVVSAVKTLHVKEVAHRDLKPPNILVHQSKVRLCDLGLCMPLTGVNPAERLTEPLERIGSVHYMPKEAFGPRPIDENQFAFDAYALGKILYELLSGRTLPGFESHLNSSFDLLALRKEPVYGGINTLLRGLLHDDPKRRLSVLRELSVEINGLIAWADELTKVAEGTHQILKKELSFAGMSLAAAVQMEQAPSPDASKKVEVEALAGAIAAKWRQASALDLLRTEIVGRNPGLLKLDIVNRTVLREWLQNALMKTKRGLEPLTDRGYPMRPPEEAGCEVGLVPADNLKAKLPELRLCCLVCYKGGVVVIAIAMLKKEPGETGAIDIVSKSEIVLSGSEFSPKLRHDCEAEAESSARKFADFTVKEFGALKPKQ